MKKNSRLNFELHDKKHMIKVLNLTKLFRFSIILSIRRSGKI